MKGLQSGAVSKCNPLRLHEDSELLFLGNAHFQGLMSLFISLPAVCLWGEAALDREQVLTLSVLETGGRKEMSRREAEEGTGQGSHSNKTIFFSALPEFGAGSVGAVVRLGHLALV